MMAHRAVKMRFAVDLGFLGGDTGTGSVGTGAVVMVPPYLSERLTARISCVADESRPHRPTAHRRTETGRPGAPISHVSCMRSLGLASPRQPRQDQRLWIARPVADGSLAKTKVPTSSPDMPTRGLIDCSICRGFGFLRFRVEPPSLEKLPNLGISNRAD